jgi:hypothetical protein
LFREGTWKKLAIALVLLAGAGVVFWQARWFVFSTRIHNVLESLARRPAPAEITALRSRINAEARALWISPDSIALDLHLEQHTSRSYATKEDMTEQYWFVVVHATRGSSVADWEKRIDTALDAAYTAALEEGGVPVKKAEKPGEKN